MATEARYLHDKVITRMVGAKIVQAFIDPEEEFAGFMIQLPDGTQKQVWVLCDPEGNGSGFLEVVDKGK